MKIGFSSLVCPSWDLATIVAKAAEYGFDGVEIRGVRGELQLPRVPELAANAGATKQLFASAGVELVCLATSCSFAARDRKEVARNRLELEETIILASRLECPFVRVFAGDVQKGEPRENTLARVAAAFTRVAPFAAEHKVTILIQNAGDFSGSADVWFLSDSVSHPAVRICWNPCVAMTLLERPTISIPRLGGRMGMVHVCDAAFDETGFMSDGYKIPGQGHVGWSRAIDLLKGTIYRGYLMFEWPKLWDSSLPSADDVLPLVAAYLRERVTEQQPVLTAYKGDKNAPIYRSIPPAASVRPA